MNVMKKRPKKKILIILSVPAVIGGILLIIGFSMTAKMDRELMNLEYHEIDLKDLEDETYQGKAETTLVTVEVAVEISNHEISEIDLLKHENGLGRKAEIIVEDMISQNTYDVDAISGATASSLVIKSAVSDALRVN
jgi:uncharacterized protein with FMN-binding domain